MVLCINVVGEDVVLYRPLNAKYVTFWCCVWIKVEKVGGYCPFKRCHTGEDFPLI